MSFVGIEVVEEGGFVWTVTEQDKAHFGQAAGASDGIRLGAVSTVLRIRLGTPCLNITVLDSHNARHHPNHLHLQSRARLSGLHWRSRYIFSRIHLSGSLHPTESEFGLASPFITPIGVAVSRQQCSWQMQQPCYSVGYRMPFQHQRSRYRNLGLER